MELVEWVQVQASRRLADLVLVGTAVGFLVILAELLLTGHTEGVQLVGVLAAAGGAALAGVALVARGRTGVIAAAALL